MLLRKFFWSVPLLLAATMSLSGQQTRATLVGTLTDPSGAVISGSTVTIVNLQTGVRRETKTDPTGNYTVPFLPEGSYSVTVAMQGFRQKEVQRVTLAVGQTGRVDFQMEVGDVIQNVTVQASVVALQTENATVGTTIDSTEITELPLNGRNFVQLAQLIPGALPGTPGSITVRRGRGSIGQSDSPFGSTGFSANGVRDTANRYYIDGIESMDGDAFTYAFSPSVDSLAEVKVETNLYAADSGAAPGGQISLITKSGTNVYHGTLWEFNRNDALTSTYDAIAHKDLHSARLNQISTVRILEARSSFPKSITVRTRRFSSSIGNPGGRRLGPSPAMPSFPPQRSVAVI